MARLTSHRLTGLLGLPGVRKKKLVKNLNISTTNCNADLRQGKPVRLHLICNIVANVLNGCNFIHLTICHTHQSRRDLKMYFNSPGFER